MINIQYLMNREQLVFISRQPVNANNRLHEFFVLGISKENVGKNVIAVCY